MPKRSLGAYHLATANQCHRGPRSCSLNRFEYVGMGMGIVRIRLPSGIASCNNLTLTRDTTYIDIGVAHGR